MPYGSIPDLTVGMRMLLHQNGFKIWDSEDWKLRSPRYVQVTIQQQFNHYTTQYNKAKKAFYESAGLKVNG